MGLENRTILLQDIIFLQDILHKNHNQLSNVSILTNNRQDDYYKVKDVPADGEEVAAESKDLNEAFSGEDDNESQVDIVENELHSRRLLIRLEHHGDHVQDDEHHDCDIKGLFGDQIKEETL